jgi:hypothetical protein
MTWRPRLILPPGTCKIAGTKVYWTQSLGAYCQVLRIYQVFSRDEVNQLDKDISEFGQNTAGTAFTQFARYSPIPNQSTGLSNEGFILSFTFRITGSLTLLFQRSGLMGNSTTCPCRKRNGEPCGQGLNGYTHLFECPSHGFRFFLNSKLEDAFFECFRDALRSQITQGAADVVIDDVTRKNARHNCYPLSPPPSIRRVIETRLNLLTGIT